MGKKIEFRLPEPELQVFNKSNKFSITKTITGKFKKNTRPSIILSSVLSI